MTPRTVTSVLILTLFPVMLVGTIVWNVLYPRLLILLRGSQPELWRELGSPRYFDYRWNVSFFRWLFKRRYTDLGDGAIVRAAGSVRVL